MFYNSGGEQDGPDSALWSEELLCERSRCESCGAVVLIDVRQPGTRPVVGPVKRTDGGIYIYPR